MWCKHKHTFTHMYNAQCTHSHSLIHTLTNICSHIVQDLPQPPQKEEKQCEPINLLESKASMFISKHSTRTVRPKQKTKVEMTILTHTNTFLWDEQTPHTCHRDILLIFPDSMIQETTEANNIIQPCMKGRALTDGEGSEAPQRPRALWCWSRCCSGSWNKQQSIIRKTGSNVFF